MKKQLMLVAAAVLGVALLGASSGSAWDAYGYVYIDESTSEPAPCVPLELTVGAECGFCVWVVFTDQFGYWRFEDLEWPTVSVNMVFTPGEVECEFCEYTIGCVADTICAEALTSLSPTVNFDLNQDNCNCDPL